MNRPIELHTIGQAMAELTRAETDDVRPLTTEGFCLAHALIQETFDDAKRRQDAPVPAQARDEIRSILTDMRKESVD